MFFSEMISAFWLSFGIAALLSYPIYQLLLRWKSRQTISEYAPEGHQVKQGTPTMGGLIIVLGLAPVLAYYWWTSASGNEAVHWWGPALLLLLGFGLIGFIDDFLVPRLLPGTRGLGWKQKILMQICVALGSAAWIFGGFGAATFLTTFVILFYSNAYNFSDGLDALAGTLLLGIAGGILALALLRGSDSTTPMLMLALIGATIPFLFLNAPPAKVFMGDVGSLPIGALLGAACCVLVLNVSNTPIEPGRVTLWGMQLYLLIGIKVLSLMMVFELVPVPLQVFWVKAFKKRLFPYTPIHHAFEKAGWKETRVVAMFALTQFLLSALAISIVATT